MDRSSIILSIAISALFISNFAFRESSYLSPTLLIELDMLGMASAILFFFAYHQRNKRIARHIVVSQYALAAIALIFLILSFQLVGIATAISIVALYLISFLSKRLKSYQLYAAIIITIVVASSFSYVAVSGLRKSQWDGVDEIAFNYYASYLLIHGVNPYTANMQPILKNYGTLPTYLLNGTIETAYDYPALSFLPVLFLGTLKLKSFLIFISIIMFISTLIAFLVYRESKYNKAVLIPIAVWLLITYIYIGTINQYVAIGIFMLLAYTTRKNIIVSSIFMGLAASTIQLAWFVIPFFLILSFREHGKEALIRSIAVVTITFLVVNSYFIAIAPVSFFKNVFGLFGTSSLVLYGPTLPQTLLGIYPVPIWYSAVVSVVALLSLMALFYLYTETLRPLMAIAPAYIFYLAWRNLPMYGLAFVPLFIVLCYGKETKGPNDLVKNRMYIPLVLAGIVLIAIILAVYSHNQYMNANTIVVNSAMPIMDRTGAPNATYVINSIVVNVTNNGRSYENVTFFLITNEPWKDGIYLGDNHTGVAPMSSASYTFTYNGYTNSSSTKLYIMAFSKDYITSRIFNLSLNGNGHRSTQ